MAALMVRIADTRRLLGILVLTGFITVGCAGDKLMRNESNNGRLAPCPHRPNCVSSMDTDQRHYIAPIVYTANKAVAIETIERVVKGIDGSRIVARSPTRMQVEFRSKWMGFVDDAIFYFPDAGVIHVRSAARTGYTDFGVNRKRIEKIRARFHQRLPRSSDT